MRFQKHLTILQIKSYYSYLWNEHVAESDKNFPVQSDWMCDICFCFRQKKSAWICCLCFSKQIDWPQFVSIIELSVHQMGHPNSNTKSSIEWACGVCVRVCVRANIYFCGIRRSSNKLTLIGKTCQQVWVWFALAMKFKLRQKKSNAKWMWK